MWRNYLYLRGVRQENRDLKDELDRLRLEQVRLGRCRPGKASAGTVGIQRAIHLSTLAAQVIGSSGSSQSRTVYIDKGKNDGLDTGMPVITSDGVVGKIWQVYSSTSQVLLLDDQSSGVGAILETSRLQGVLRGKPSGDVILEKIMADEQVQPGEKVLTSGGDQIFPKGLAIGSVMKVSRSADSFLTIRVRPSADLSKLEEVLVITQREQKAPAVSQTNMRAADILAMRLPSVPDKPAEDPNKPGAKTAAPVAEPDAGSTPKVVPPSGAPSKPDTSSATGRSPRSAVPVMAPPASKPAPPTSTPNQGKPQ